MSFAPKPPAPGRSERTLQHRTERTKHVQPLVIRREEHAARKRVDRGLREQRPDARVEVERPRLNVRGGRQVDKRPERARQVHLIRRADRDVATCAASHPASFGKQNSERMLFDRKVP